MREFGRAPGEAALAQTRLRHRWGGGGQLEMTQDTAHDGSVGDGGDEAKGTGLTLGAAHQSAAGRPGTVVPGATSIQGSDLYLRFAHFQSGS